MKRREFIADRWLISVVCLICSAGLAADPSFYVKRDTWPETVLASREALAAMMQAGEIGMSLPDLGESDFTMTAWLRTESRGGTIVAKAPKEEGWAPQGKVLFLRAGRPAFDVGWVGAVESDARISDGKWHHVALSKAERLTFYVDGRAAHSGTLTRMGPDAEEHLFKIGYCTHDFPEQSGFEGDLDEVRVYDRELGEAEIRAIYQDSGEVGQGLAGWWRFESGARDASGNKNHGQVAGAEVTTGRFGSALRFSGHSQVILPSSQAAAARARIWDLVMRDFPDEHIQAEIRLEREDGIWNEDWPVGNLSVLGRRYGEACRDIGGLSEKAKRVALGLTTVNQLQKIRQVYHLSRRAEEVCGDVSEGIRAMQQEIDYLAENHSDGDAEWIKYKRRVRDLARESEKWLSKLIAGDPAAVEEISRLEGKRKKVHESTPLRLPSGPVGPGRFGAYYTTLRYSFAWDQPWRVGPHADVIVRFDDADYKFVFWRGTSYIPCWVTDTGVWYTNEFIERRGHHSPNTDGCVEPMSDKQCRFSHVRILESSDARVVIHWRYAPVDVRYNHPFVDPLTGWSDWVDEIYTIYPDGAGVREITAHTTRPQLWMEWQESIVVNQPGTKPDDNIELGAVTLANMQGQAKTYYWTKNGAPEFGEPETANIARINLKATHKPFAIVQPPKEDGMLITPYRGHAPGSCFNWWDHWPVSQEASDSRVTTSADRPSHTSLCHIGLAGMATARWPYYAEGENRRTKIMLHGMSDKPVSSLVSLARSWLDPPDLKLAERVSSAPRYANEGYDPTQRAWVLTCMGKGTPSTLELEVKANDDAPVVNPALVVRDWGRVDARLRINDKKAILGKDFRLGYRPSEKGCDLVVWMKVESHEPVTVKLLPTVN